MKKHWSGAAALLLLAGCGFSQELPDWLNVGGSYRALGQISPTADFDGGRYQNLYLGRLRVHADAQLRPGVEVYLEGQDARVSGLSNDADAEGLRNEFDFRQGWIRLGSEKSTLQLQAGRQELSFGDERLVGADNFLDPLGFTWDAAQATFRKGDLKVRTFAALRVAVSGQRMDRTDAQGRLYGVYVTLPKFWKKLQVEPYFFFNEQTGLRDENEFVGNRIGVFGFRAMGSLTPALDYNIEMVGERGQFRNEAMRSWAGHWELDWRVGRSEHAPRLIAEYNWASGDSHPSDKVHSTFDDLYPAGYNAYGMADPFAWRNISNPAVRAEVPLARNWSVLGGWRSYSLVTVQDGLYTVGEECLTRNPAAKSSRVGQQLSLAAAWQTSEHWKLNAGYARFFAGPYLQQSGFQGQSSSTYISLAFLF